MEEIKYYAKSIESSVTEFSNSFAIFESVKARIDDPFKLQDLAREIDRIAVSFEKLDSEREILVLAHPEVGDFPELELSQISALQRINSSFSHDLSALRLLFNKGSKDVLKSLIDFLADSASHNLAVAAIQHVDLDDDEKNLKLE